MRQWPGLFVPLQSDISASISKEREGAECPKACPHSPPACTVTPCVFKRCFCAVSWSLQGDTAHLRSQWRLSPVQAGLSGPLCPGVWFVTVSCVCMCLCTSVCVCTCFCARACVYGCVCVLLCSCLYMTAFVCECTFVHVCMCACPLSPADFLHVPPT